jgi:hypothetical protein
MTPDLCFNLKSKTGKPMSFYEFTLMIKKEGSDVKSTKQTDKYGKLVKKVIKPEIDPQL